MYILTRYVVWEVLKFFLVALIGLTLCVTLGYGVKEAMNKGLPALVVLRTMPVTLPTIFGITIPVAMLYSVSSVFGRMTGANELIALKSMGISPMAVVWPVAILASFLSLGTVWMYEIAATWSQPTVLRILSESIEQIAYSKLQKDRTFKGDQFSITVKCVDPPAKSGGKPILIEPTITLYGPPDTIISAAEATLQTDWNAHMLEITCRDSEVDIQGKVRARIPGERKYRRVIAVPGPAPYGRDWVAMSAVPDLVAELQTTIRQLETFRDVNRMLGISEAPQEQDKIGEYRFLLYRLRAEPYRRWANGFTCLCFALIGTPVAMLWRHADVLTNFFVCFLPILAIYYPLLILSDDMATSGKFPPVTFWTGNMVLLIPAILLLRWIVRH